MDNYVHKNIEVIPIIFSGWGFGDWWGGGVERVHDLKSASQHVRVSCK